MKFVKSDNITINKKIFKDKSNLSVKNRDYVQIHRGY